MENEPANSPTNSQHITPADIQRQEFGVSRFGGYRMRDVDEFLDRLTESTELLVAENERLRAGVSPIIGTSDLDDVNRQADEIVQRARDEAARIEAAARERAATATGDAPATGAAPGGSQPAVDAFLGQERSFLQSLATLVQGHAESVKGMAREARRSASASEPTPPTRPASSSTAGDEISLPEASDGAEEAPADANAEAAAGAGPDETVVLEVPQPTASRRDGGREGDPSLRQLFWGEDR